MEEKNRYNSIKEFLSAYCGLLDEEVTLNSDIQGDFGIYGDDAVELILAYGQRFNVDVSMFIISDYFKSEGDQITSSITEMFVDNPKTKKILTVEHLLNGMITGKLD